MRLFDIRGERSIPPPSPGGLGEAMKKKMERKRKGVILKTGSKARYATCTKMVQKGISL